jgi:hypothetical protein
MGMKHLKKQIIHSHNKIKAMWNSIKSETGRNNIKYDKANVYNTDKEYNKSVNEENFNKYFLTTAETIFCKITGNSKQNINSTKYSLFYLSQIFNFPFINIVFHNTSTGEIEKIIHSFPWKSLCGYVEISMKIVKISASFISSPLCRTINISLNLGVFPTRLKYSIITQLYKRCDKNNVTNYRQISLLSFSKIFEKIIYKRLITHIAFNNIFTNSKFGFRKKPSTNKAAYKLINDILIALNNKRIVGGIFFDLERLLTV